MHTLHIRETIGTRLSLTSAALGLLLTLGLGATASAQTSDDAVAPEARQHLKAMSDLLAGAETLAFNAYIVQDQVVSFGQKIQLAQHRDVLLERPNRVHVKGDGDLDQVSYWFNAGKLSAYDAVRDVYTTVEVPDTIEPMLDHLAYTFGMVVPMADLLVDDPYESAMLGGPAGWYLGLHDVRGVPCHHLAFRQPGIDWQIWIDAGEQPVPRKLLITFSDVASQPQWTGEFSDWQINPEIDPAAFEFSPAAGAMEVSGPEFSGRGSEAEGQ